MTLLAEEAHLIARASFSAQELVAKHPPRLSDRNKKIVFGLSCPPGAKHAGTLVVSRWRAMPLPDDAADSAVDHVVREDIFGYEPAPAGTMNWYVNFADLRLFVAYGSPLFAQDELQVTEHPALASLREALVAAADPKLAPTTREGDRPAPVLIRGVERRCAVATDPDLLEGRPYGLYGNQFARGKEDAVKRATTVLTPPTISNIVAMEAPPGGTGTYTLAKIRDVVVTAFTGFRAARVESSLAGAARVVVHTGHWGTGAYGGNRVLMALLQMLAAHLAGLDGLVFHTVDEAGAVPYRRAREILDRDVLPLRDVGTILWRIERMGFVWGESDGN